MNFSLNFHELQMNGLEEFCPWRGICVKGVEKYLYEYKLAVYVS